MSVFVAKKNKGNNMYTLPEKTAKDNQAQFLKKYSVNVEMPSMYVLDA